MAVYPCNKAIHCSRESRGARGYCLTMGLDSGTGTDLGLLQWTWATCTPSLLPGTWAQAHGPSRARRVQTLPHYIEYIFLTCSINPPWSQSAFGFLSLVPSLMSIISVCLSALPLIGPGCPPCEFIVVGILSSHIFRLLSIQSQVFSSLDPTFLICIWVPLPFLSAHKSPSLHKHHSRKTRRTRCFVNWTRRHEIIWDMICVLHTVDVYLFITKIEELCYRCVFNVPMTVAMLGFSV